MIHLFATYTPIYLVYKEIDFRISKEIEKKETASNLKAQMKGFLPVRENS